MRTGVANLLSSACRTAPVQTRSLLIRLLLDGIDINPGPVKRIDNSKNSIKNDTLGTLNARSIVNKTEDFHLTFEVENINVVAITETRVPSDAPIPSVTISFHQGIPSSMILARMVVAAGVWLASTVCI